MLQVVKFGLLFALSIMAVGGYVGSWQFAVGALRSLMAKPTTQVTFATKSCSTAKLHWRIFIMLVGYRNQDSNRPLMTTLFINDTSICERGINSLSHLHS